MKLITKKEKIEKNLETIEHYLSHGSVSEQEATQKLIGKGKCLIAYKKGKFWHFAPSRFIGYVSNFLKKHLNNDQKDGKDTNPAIEYALECKFVRDMEMESTFINYCGQIGTKPSAYSKRRYIRLE